MTTETASTNGNPNGTPNTLSKVKSNTELGTIRPLSHSTSITGVADLQNATLSPERDDASVNLCSASLGAKVLFATDEWFATADNLLKDTDPEFDEDAYCPQGKVMDGWETRRRREEGYDWCLIQLASPFFSVSSKTKLIGIEVDTAHFTGNHTPRVSLEVASVDDTMSIVNALPNGMERLLRGGKQGSGHTPDEVRQAATAIENVDFQMLLPQTPLEPGFENSRYHYYDFNTPLEGNLIKLNYYPDGGVARLKLWAVEDDSLSDGPEVKQSSNLYMPIETCSICTVVSHTEDETAITKLPSQQEYEHPEISSQEFGGTGLACSNKHYGEPWRLIQKSLGKGMWDGWETARHPSRPPVLIKNPETNLIDSPLNDWCILKLGQPANDGVAKVIIDTKHFLGNYPESVSLEGCSEMMVDDGAKWFPLVERTRMSPNAEHVFERSQNQLKHSTEVVTHVRLSTFPDGGVSRVRVYG